MEALLVGPDLDGVEELDVRVLLVEDVVEDHVQVRHDVRRVGQDPLVQRVGELPEVEVQVRLLRRDQDLRQTMQVEQQDRQLRKKERAMRE